MKRTSIMKRAILLTAIIVLFAAGAAAAEDIAKQLQKGLFEEEGNRDLAAAIKAYETVLKQFDTDRQFASTAAFRLGECLRKQGKQNEAATYYLRVLRDFSDQTNLVQLATIHLKASGQMPAEKAGATASRATSAATPDLALTNLKKELLEIDVQLERVEQLRKQGLHQSIVTLTKDDALAALIKEHNALRLDKSEKLKIYSKDHPIAQKLAAAEDQAFQQIHEHILNVIQGLQIGKSVIEKKLAEQQRAEWPGSPAISAKYRPATREEAEALVLAQKLVRESPDMVNRGSGKEMPALHRAAAAGHLAAAAFLVDNGADINAVWSYQGLTSGTPLHMAVNAGQKTAAEFLLGKGADINSLNAKGQTPLLVAVSRNFDLLTDLLLAKNADVNVGTKAGATPLHFAAERGYGSLIDKLLKAGAKVDAKIQIREHVDKVQSHPDAGHTASGFYYDKDLSLYHGSSPLHAAAIGGHEQIVQRLLAAGADPNNLNAPGYSPLLHALSSKSSIDDLNSARASVGSLLSAGANPNAFLPGHPSLSDKRFKSALHFAIETDDIRLVKLLIDKGADIQLHKYHPEMHPSIFTAVHGRPRPHNPEIARLLLENGADPNERFEGGTILGWAAAHNAPQIAKLLLDGGARINDLSDGQASALSIAIELESIDMVRLFLERGADPNLAHFQGSVPLRYALEQNMEIAETLLKHGANPNFTYSSSNTPDWPYLVHARFRNSMKFAQMLLEKKADPNLASPDGNSPLHWAAMYGDAEFTNFLLQHGADPNALNNNGKSPRDLAKADSRERPTRPITRRGGRAQIGAGAKTWQAGSSPFRTRLEQQPQERKPAQATRTSDSNELAALLKKHGALDDPARAQYITATRKSTDTQIRVFGKSSHPKNRFTLTEFLHTTLNRAWSTTLGIEASPFKFPDLTAVTINRNIDGEDSSQVVNFLDHLRSDSAKPIWLEWGDSIEIPERAHPVNESWPGLDAREWLRLNEKLHRRVTFRVGGKDHVFALLPALKSNANNHELAAEPNLRSVLDRLGVYDHRAMKPSPIRQANLLGAFQEQEAKQGNKTDEELRNLTVVPFIRTFWLKRALKESNTLLTTSDTGAIKIYRKSADARDTDVIEFDLDSAGTDDVWLQDGDVIEIPEKK